MDIKQRLEEYKENRARLAIVRSRITQLIETISEKERDLPTLSYEPPLVTGLVRPSYDAQPKTKRIYGNNKGGEDTDTPELRQLRADLVGAYREAGKMAIEVEHIGIALQGLGEKPRMVIELTYMEKLSWQNIAERFEKLYGYYPSERSIKYLRCSGMEQLARILGD